MSISQGHKGLDKSVTISDATASKYRILTGDTTDTTNSLLVMAANATVTTASLAVLQEATTAADQKATARFSGVSKIEVDGSQNAIDVNDSIIPSTGGLGIIAGAPAQTQQWAIGFALEPSGASGDEIDVLINPHLIVKGAA